MPGTMMMMDGHGGLLATLRLVWQYRYWFKMSWLAGWLASPTGCVGLGVILGRSLIFLGIIGMGTDEGMGVFGY